MAGNGPEPSMTERRALPDVSAAVVESLGDAVIIAFPDGQMRMNPVARELYGLADGDRPERATFRQSFELVAEDGGVIPVGKSPMDRALRGEASSGTYTQRDVKRGTERTYRMVANPVHGAEGAVVAGIVSMYDLTEQREAERQKDEFLSIVSHELKTPLTPLKALAQLIRLRLKRHREDGRTLDLDSLDTNLRTIERQVDRMAGLVNDLLEVSRAGQRRFELQPQEFDLAPVVPHLVHPHAHPAAPAGPPPFPAA